MYQKCVECRHWQRVNLDWRAHVTHWYTCQACPHTDTYKQSKVQAGVLGSNNYEPAKRGKLCKTTMYFHSKLCLQHNNTMVIINLCIKNLFLPCNQTLLINSYHCTVGHLSMAVLFFKEIERDTMYEQIPSMNTCCLIWTQNSICK